MMQAIAPRAEQHPASLAESLRDPACYPHPCGEVKVIETHISWVFLAGSYAYKVKKPVKLDFLDFSTLEARRFYCEEEIRLNRRTAPGLYVELVPIVGTVSRPAVGGAGPPIDYAVRMRRFAQEDLLSRRADAGVLEPAAIDDMAASVARLHMNAGAVRQGLYGTPMLVRAQALDNFATLERLDPTLVDPHLERWTRLEQAALANTLAARRREGFVREGHGDLHLGNVVMFAGRPVAFDCIEFDSQLRIIDVMSDVAFACMDLHSRGQPRLAARFLNAWLEHTGDYAGLRVLRFYEVYRAMVRAKVAAIRSRQPGIAPDDRESAQGAFGRSVALARRLALRRSPALILMHGLSGSGKTTISQDILEALGAVRLRSDLERKRLHGIAPLARSHSSPGAGIYGRMATQETYGRLARLARETLGAGHRTIVDATFLYRAQREAFHALARAMHVPFAIVACMAPEATLRERLAGRSQTGLDASEADDAVLDLQLARREDLSAEEMRSVVIADTRRRDVGEEASLMVLAKLLGRER